MEQYPDKQDIFPQFSLAYDPDRLSYLLQQVGTVLFTDDVAPLKIVNKNAFCIPKTKASNFPANETNLAFFEAEEDECFLCLD